MGFLVRLVLALVFAVALGAAYAWHSLDSIAEADFPANGAWRIAPDMSDASLTIFARAALAKTSLLAPEKRDAIDLIANVDETGAALDGRCTYRVQGAAPPSGTWSLMAYGLGHNLIASQENRSAISSKNAAAGGNISVRVSATDQPGVWLPLDGARKFSLTLRLYDPAPGVGATPASFVAPRLIKEGCR